MAYPFHNAILNHQSVFLLYSFLLTVLFLYFRAFEIHDTDHAHFITA